MQIQQTDIFGIDQTSQLSLDKNDPSYSQTRNCLQLSHDSSNELEGYVLTEQHSPETAQI